MDPVYGYQAVNVEAQQRHPTPLLHWMQQMIALRKKHPVFGRGAPPILKPENRRVLAFTRSYAGETVLCIYNLARSPQPVQLDLGEYAGRTPIDLQYRIAFPRIEASPYQLALNEYGFHWFVLQDGPDGKTHPAA
jgi:maltose alpha-D-glucosyltransferase/alpha-amylase